MEGAAPALGICEVSLIEATPGTLREQIRLRHEAERALQDREEMPLDYRLFIRGAWEAVEPHVEYTHGWHIDAIAEFLMACSAGEIRRGQIWIPPGMMKSLNASIFWPAWEWTHSPWLRVISGSYDIDLSTEFAVKTRGLITSEWYQARWGDLFELTHGRNLKRSYSNNQGGARFASSPTGGVTGRHAHRILIDDPLNAMEILSAADMDAVIEWHDGALSTRWADPKTGVELIIAQRLHERDLCGHVLKAQEWEILCLPEEYNPNHKHAWIKDPRTEPGELLWPERVGPAEHETRVSVLGSYRASGQLQQEPSSAEGEILKRPDWRYYPQDFLADVSRFPRKFMRVVSSWDTTFKDKTDSDFVVGTLWGSVGADKYLLRRFKAQVGLEDCKTAMKEQRQWALDRFPWAAYSMVVENTANGPDIIKQFKREIPGVFAITVKGDKKQRAIAASPDLESHNVFVPGQAKGDGTGPDEGATPAWVCDFIEECAKFDKGEHDDDVDSFSQAINWIRLYASTGGVSRPRGKTPTPHAGR